MVGSRAREMRRLSIQVDVGSALGAKREICRLAIGSRVIKDRELLWLRLLRDCPTGWSGVLKRDAPIAHRHVEVAEKHNVDLELVLCARLRDVVVIQGGLEIVRLNVPCPGLKAGDPTAEPTMPGEESVSRCRGSPCGCFIFGRETGVRPVSW